MVDYHKEETDTHVRGVCFAPFLLIVGLLVLIYNEGHVRSQHNTFRNTNKSITDVEAESAVKSENDGKLIHLYGWTKASSGTVQDPLFGVSKSGIIKLQRSVEMYQWDETFTSATAYEYSTAWEHELVDSSEFEESETHSNPTSFPFEFGVYYATETKLGNYVLSSDVLNQMNWFENYDGSLSTETVTDESTKQNLQIYNNVFYTGNPTSPSVGDARVAFAQIPEEVISVVGMQTSGGGVAPFVTPQGNTILLVQPGWHSAKQMMNNAHANATSWKGWLRLLAFFLIFCGFKIIVEPMSVVADVVEDQFPFFADLVYSASNGAVAYLSGFTFMTVMALCWITYAPFASLMQLGLVGASAQIAKRLIRSERVPKVRVTSAFDQFYEMLPMDNVI